jgi:hypothetical protein
MDRYRARPRSARHHPLPAVGGAASRHDVLALADGAVEQQPNNEADAYPHGGDR